MATISAVTHYFFVSKALKSVFILCLASTDYLKLWVHNFVLVACWGHSPKPLLGYAQTLLTSSEMERPYGLAKAGVVATLKAIYRTIYGI